jgi:hypothetical protein
MTAMKNLFSSNQTWQDLYRAAGEFKNLRPWEWMFDDQVFGVQNPANGEIGYCCIMGAAGEVFALGVYLGSDGLEIYSRIQSGQIDPGEVFYTQRCLVASFEDRDELNKPDLDRIKSLGLKFRGRNSWPLFRSFLPGYQPWYLTDDEAEYLTLALQQATQVARRVRDDEDLLKSKLKNHYFVRVPERQGDALSWQDAWLPPAPLPKKEFSVPPPDSKRLAALKKNITKKQGLWEIDVFYSPLAIKEQGRPYYPLMLFCVDQKYELLLLVDLAPQSEYKQKFQDKFLELMERVKFFPEGLFVEKPDVFRLFERLAADLNIQIRLIDRLIKLPEARAKMTEHFLPH